MKTRALTNKDVERAALSVPQMSAVPGQLVVATPHSDNLIWGATALQEFVQRVLGATPLPGSARPGPLRAAILEQNPRRFYALGHGAAHLFTVEFVEWFLNSRTYLNMDLVSGRYVHLLSCITGRELGPTTVKAGALAYFGYAEYFWFITWIRPGGGRFIDAVYYGDLEIQDRLAKVAPLEAATWWQLREIYAASIRRHNMEIDYWSWHWHEEHVDGNRIPAQYAQLLIDVIIVNRDALVVYHPIWRGPEMRPLGGAGGLEEPEVANMGAQPPFAVDLP